MDISLRKRVSAWIFLEQIKGIAHDYFSKCSLKYSFENVCRSSLVVKIDQERNCGEWKQIIEGSVWFCL